MKTRSWVIAILSVCVLWETESLSQIQPTGAPGGDSMQGPWVERMSDSSLVAHLGIGDDSIFVTRGVPAEVFRRGERMIPLLLARRKDRRVCIEYGLGNPRSSTLIPASGPGAIPVEQAAIYLIEAIYLGTLEFARSPYFCDSTAPRGQREKLTSPEVNERAWQSIDRWLEKYHRLGLEGVREEHQDPLQDSGLYFY